MMTGCPRQIQVTPNNSMQRTALRAAADAERSEHWKTTEYEQHELKSVWARGHGDFRAVANHEAR
jgi:hypothetical protein